jgi:hypothetical protein
MDFAVFILLPLKVGLRKPFLPVWILNFRQRRLVGAAASRLRERTRFGGHNEGLADPHFRLPLWGGVAT